MPYVTRESLSPDKRAVFDRIAGTRGYVPHLYQALLNNPNAADAVAKLGEYIRYRSPLDPAVRETAILSTARAMNSEYEWSQHAPVARQLGIEERVIDEVRSGGEPTGVPAEYGAVVRAARELVRDGTLSDSTFHELVNHLGPERTVDLIVLVGFYSMMGRVLAALEVDLDDGLEPDLGA